MPNIFDEKRKKFDPKSEKLFMVRYANEGCRLLDPESEIVKVGRDVVFDESQLYKDVYNDDTVNLIEENVENELAPDNNVELESNSENDTHYQA